MTETVDILLVDDEPRNLDALEAILTDPAYRLLRAEDANSALKHLVERDVAAIVLDIKMPGTSGFELAQMIKATKRYRQIPILFLTAYLVEDQDIITGYGAGAVDYLTKPLNPEIVRRKVAVFAELFRKSRALAELNDKLEQRVQERTAELQKSEEALRAADRKKDEFIAVLAHELRNPLAPLRFGLDIVGKHQSPDAPPVVRRTLGIMNRQLEHMVRLIDDLLDISRISRGKIELKNEPVNLQTIVQAAIDMNRPYLERRGHTLTVTRNEPAGVHGDPTRLAQIIGNLLHNAAKFTPEGGHIDVSLVREGDAAVVRVHDTGEGIAPAQIEQAFDMFARVGNAASSAERGLGIGLALGRRLAEMHGGALTAHSDGLGRGSTFTLRLPATEVVEQASAPVAASPAASPMRALDVVVIEDTPDVAETLATWLTEMGHRVSLATCGMDGIELVAQRTPDLVLCDLGLPDIDGVEVCRRLRCLPLAAQPRIIALTGWGRDVDRRKTEEAGFDQHLVKPIAADALRSVLATLTFAEPPRPFPLA